MKINNIQNPITKDDYIARLKVIAEVGVGKYDLKISVREWENYGKNRTYFKINAFRKCDGKFHHDQDYGYFDNINNVYVSTNKYKKLDGKVFDAAGMSIDEQKITEALKKIN